MNDVPVPFIVGVPRSGTTLIRATLASHQDLTIPEEAAFRVSMSDGRRRYERRTGQTSRHSSAGLLAHAGLHRWAMSEDEVRTVVRRAVPQTFSDAMRASSFT